MMCDTTLEARTMIQNVTRVRIIKFRQYNPATFNGKHNVVKARCFIILRILDSLNLRPTAGQLASIAGISENCARAHLVNWQKWAYVKRERVPGNYLYELATPGAAWLDRNWNKLITEHPDIERTAMSAVKSRMEQDGIRVFERNGCLLRVQYQPIY